jgi:hypothetical protein
MPPLNCIRTRVQEKGIGADRGEEQDESDGEDEYEILELCLFITAASVAIIEYALCVDSLDKAGKDLRRLRGKRRFIINMELHRALVCWQLV